MGRNRRACFSPLCPGRKQGRLIFYRRARQSPAHGGAPRSIKKHPSYTFAGGWGELFDVRTSRKTASVYHQAHECISINEQFLQGFADYATRAVHISDGTHDVFGAHDVFFNEIAREIAPIRLTGKFGSEVVRIRRLIPSITYRQGFLEDDIGTLVEQLPSYTNTNPGGNSLTGVVTEEIPWHEYARVAVEQSQLVLRTPYMDNELVKLMYQAPQGFAGSRQSSGTLRAGKSTGIRPRHHKHGPLHEPESARHEASHYLFSALLKVEYIYLYATPHWMTWVDRKLEPWHLERLLSGRQKWEGYRIWIKTAFAPFLRDTLSNPNAEYTRFFDYQTVLKMVDRHIAGTHNYIDEINKAVTIQLIF